jgi:hypothetical protein
MVDRRVLARVVGDDVGEFDSQVVKPLDRFAGAVQQHPVQPRVGVPVAVGHGRSEHLVGIGNDVQSFLEKTLYGGKPHGKQAVPAAGIHLLKKDYLFSLLGGGNGRSQPRRPAADNGNIGLIRFRNMIVHLSPAY